jgi:isopentenyl phosphate kinase
VTGGMSSKVHEMVRLVARGYTERVHVISGLEDHVLTRVLVDTHATDGTTITGDRCSIERNMG